MEGKGSCNIGAYSIGSLYPRSAPRVRNLGGAIVMAAIADYRGRDEEAHEDAARFLYPTTDAARRHYAWAVALDDEVNAAWLRESLDRVRAEWDAQRRRRRKQQRRNGNEQRTGLGDGRLHDWRKRAAGAAVKPAHTASAAGPYEAAPGV